MQLDHPAGQCAAFLYADATQVKLQNGHDSAITKMQQLASITY